MHQDTEKGFWSKNRIIITFGIVVSYFVSAWIGASVNDYFSRSRPFLEIANIDFSGIASKKAKFMPSNDLVVLQRNSPIGIKEFAGFHSLEGYEQILFMTNQQIALSDTAINTLEKIIETLNSRDLDTKIQIDKLRIELLQMWDKVPYAILEKETRSVLHKKGYIKEFKREERYKKYLNHPKEWKTPLTAKLQLSPTRSFDLSEIDMKEYDYKKEIWNIFKRLWIYMDKDLMIEIFETTRNELISVNNNTVKFRDALVFEINQFNPERIHCDIVFSNLGKKAAVFKGIGLLKLKKGDEEVNISIKACKRNEELNAFSIAGGCSSMVDFYSNQTLEEIESEIFPNLKAIYDSKVLNCNISFAKLSANSEFEKIQCSGIFGKEANLKYIEKLR